MTPETTTIPTTKRIIKVDASAMKISSCRRRLYLTVLEGWRSKVLPNDVEIGIAFHKFPAKIEEMGGDAGFGVGILEVTEYFDKTPMFVKPKKTYMTSRYLANACQLWYSEMYKKDNAQVLRADDGTPMVEIPFEITIYEDAECIINVTGTIDKVVKFKNGCLAIGDYKTTSSWEKDKYFQGYLLSVQLRLYLWAIWHMCKTAPSGSFFSTIKSVSSIGMFIDGIFFNGEAKTEFARSPIMFLKPETMEQFESMLQKYVLLVKELAMNNVLPEPDGIMTDSCQTKFGPCPFFGACAAPDAVAFGHTLKNNFIQKSYDPLNFHGEL